MKSAPLHMVRDALEELGYKVEVFVKDDTTVTFRRKSASDPGLYIYNRNRVVVGEATR